MKGFGDLTPAVVTLVGARACRHKKILVCHEMGSLELGSAEEMKSVRLFSEPRCD
jgi:hypothetical protein